MSFTGDTITWAEAQNRAMPLSPLRMTDEAIQKRIIEVLGSKRLSFKQIQANCMQHKNRLRLVLNGMCMAGTVRSDHRQQTEVPLLRGNDRLSPPPKAMYSVVC